VRTGNRLVLLLRAGWLVVPLAVAPAVAGALDGRDGFGLVLTVLWTGWAVGLVATFVPSTASLTAIRVLAPVAVGIAVVTAFSGAGAPSVALAVTVTTVVTVLAFTAEVGEAFVQGSAYGDERRFPLRPPAALLAGPIVVAWVLAVGPLVAAVLLLAAGQWVAGAVLAVGGIVLAVVLVRRLHRLSTRFVVLVPAGFVVHDPVLLAQTAMFRRVEVAGLGLARQGTDDVDLSGPALGRPVEVRLRRPCPVVVAGTLQQRQGRTVDAGAFLVAPTRPGRLLAEAARRGYTVS
jgi:hypothetical protein